MSHQSDNNSSPDSRLRDLTIIADDLTGACDAAVAFTDVAAGVRVHFGSEFSASDHLAVISTNSRDLPPAAAEHCLAELATKVPPNHAIFKKIDSVFRGNTFVEIAASIRLFPADLVIVAPAYPAMDRRIRGGILEIQSHGSRDQLPVLTLLRQHGCAAEIIPASIDSDVLKRELANQIASTAKVLLCDATDQEHLNALVQAVGSLSAKPLWIGSGALGHALAARLPRREAVSERHRTGDVIFFIGSDHPVTRGQQLHLERMSGIGLRRQEYPTGSRIVNVSRGASDAEILTAISDLDTDRIGCLFLTGGDTALSVCNALGITSLRLQQEFQPGVPLCVAEGGRFEGLSVILKSGGFGERDLLCRILDSFAGKECVTAA